MHQTNIPSLVKKYKLSPHPEGGWYREVHRSLTNVIRTDGIKRSGISTVLYLLDDTQVSRWHRVIGSDEVWIHLKGSPLNLYRLDDQGEHDIKKLSADAPIQVIPASQWMAAETLGQFTLVTCCVGPGFDFADFEMLRNTPEGEWPKAARKDLV